jgi:hypothetical protein
MNRINKRKTGESAHVQRARSDVERARERVLGKVGGDRESCARVAALIEAARRLGSIEESVARAEA